MSPLLAHVGPMFAQKTTTLVRVYRITETLGLDPVAIVPSILARSGATFTTHDGDSIDAVLVHTANGLLDYLDRHPVVLIDEVQAMDAAELGEVLSGWLNKRAALGRRSVLILAGLDLDAVGRPFPWVDVVRALGGVVAQHTAVCAVCGRVAQRTIVVDPAALQAITDGQPVVGGPELFSPRCPDHLTD